MQRFQNSWCASFLILSSGCAFSEGNPWGIAEVSLDAAFAPASSRLTEEGWLKTSSDYAVLIRSLELDIESVSLEMDISGQESVAFDPASPPQGFSLCHNGHCHSDDGRLVDYEEVIRETSGQGDAGNFVLRLPGSSVALEEVPTSVSLGACSSPRCWLERGQARRVSVIVSAIQVDAEVFDLRTPSRLPTRVSRSPAPCRSRLRLIA